MKTLNLSVFVVMIFFSAAALAQQSPSAAPSSSLNLDTAVKNPEFKETHEITDSKLRAQSGSLSKYSLRFDLTYAGPAIGTPLAKDQPNPDNVLRQNATNLKGSIGARYRLSPTDSLSLTGGISAIHPFHGMERFDMNNPTLGYDKFHRFGSFQARNALSVSAETTPIFRQVGAAAALAYGSSLVYDFGTTGFSAGVDGLLYYRIYDREYQVSDRSATRYSVILSPLFKYNFSDRLSLGTSTNFVFWNPRARDNEWALLPQTVNQRLNLGYAITKDVYLAPFLNIYPSKVAWDTTTVNIQTIFSLM